MLINSLSNWLFTVPLNTSLETAVVRCVTVLITTIGSIFLAYLIAPSHKFKASVSIGFIWFLVIGACVIIVATGVRLGGSQQTILDGGVSIASTIIGVSAGLIITKKLGNSTTEEQRLIESIARIEGLDGMTVNERLYHSGLNEQFYQASKTDHRKARNILMLLKVDAPSIELILKQTESH